MIKEKMLAVQKDARVVQIWGSTLHHIDDLPYDPIEYCPHVYGFFRKKHADVKVRPLLDTPTKGQLPLPDPANMTDTEKKASTFMPDLKEDFGFSDAEIKASGVSDKRSCIKFAGGEKAAIERMTEYIHSRKAVSKYASTRNMLLGRNYASKMSPWLAIGAISIRKIFWELQDFEKKNTRNESTTVYLDELFWRDFNRWWCMHHGNKVFSEYGIYDREYYQWKTNKSWV